MTTHPYTIQSDATVASTSGAKESRALVAKSQSTLAPGAIAKILAAGTDDGTEQTSTTMTAQPVQARNITATSAGTAGDIGAVQVIVNGTNVAGEVITETLPIFTADSGTTVVGSKAFATVTSVVLPAHDALGATTSIGDGAKLGLAHQLVTNTVIPGMTTHTSTREGTEPTVAVSATVVESNTITPNTALDGSEVEAFYLVSPAD